MNIEGKLWLLAKKILTWKDWQAIKTLLFERNLTISLKPRRKKVTHFAWFGEPFLNNLTIYTLQPVLAKCFVPQALCWVILFVTFTCTFIKFPLERIWCVYTRWKIPHISIWSATHSQSCKNSYKQVWNMCVIKSAYIIIMATVFNWSTMEHKFWKSLIV